MINLIIITILLIRSNVTESKLHHKLRYIRSEEATTTTTTTTTTVSTTLASTTEQLTTTIHQSTAHHLATDLYFEGEPEILSRSGDSVDLKIYPLKSNLRDKVQAYFVVVETVNPDLPIIFSDQPDNGPHESRNYTSTYGQSADTKLPYYAAIKLSPDQLNSPLQVIIGSNEKVNNFLNPPLQTKRQYRFGLAALLTDNTFLFVHSSRSVILESSDLINSLIALFGGLIIILLVVIGVLCYYLREAEVDVHWQDVVMIWSKRHRSSLFKDKNRSYRRCQENNHRLTTPCATNGKLSPGKHLSGTPSSRFNSTSYINMEVEHHLIDLPTLIVSITDPSFVTILQTEFNGIPFMQMPTVDGTKPENRKKNRYVYLPAFDFNRVKLIVEDDEIEQGDSKESMSEEANKNVTDGSTAAKCGKPMTGLQPTDYINASYIDGYNQVKSYIATQGPLKWTFNDFWKMMWQQDCSQIVMLTGLFENGRIKCDQYWPDDEGTVTYGKIEVKHLSTDTDANDYVIRRFIMTKGDESREVRLYHYINWPDHGVPADPEPLLNLIEKINFDGKQLPSQGPIVTHCSAGVGRTGTYIMIDIMMKMGEQENNIDVLGQLYLLRRQRTHMIEVEDQYHFVHKTLAQYFTKKSNAVKQVDTISSNDKVTKQDDKQSTTEPQLIAIDSEDKLIIEP